MSRRWLLCLAATWLAATASGLGQDKTRAEKGDQGYERIELKGRLKLEKNPDAAFSGIPIRAIVNGWELDLSDERGRPIPAKIDAAKKLEGKMVIATGKPSIHPVIPLNGLGQGTIWKGVTSATLKEAGP